MGITNIRFSAASGELGGLQQTIRSNARTFLAPCLGLDILWPDETQAQSNTSEGQRLSVQA